MAMIPRQKPAIPERYERICILIREKPRTIAELARVVKLQPKTIRTYLSEIAKIYDVYAQGAHGATTYVIREPSATP